MRSKEKDRKARKAFTGKFKALVCALAACLACACLPAIALAEGGSLSISSTGNAEAVTYQAVRIADAEGLPLDDAFDWDSLSGTTLGDVQLPEYDSTESSTYAKNLAGRNLVEATSDVVAADEDGSIAYALSGYLVEGVSSTSVTVDGGAVSVEDGWYLLTATGRRPLLAWVEGEAVTLGDKADVPTLVKEVLGVTSEDWSDSATFGTGHALSYRLTFGVPQSYELYTTYECAIYDTFDEELVVDEDSIAVTLVHGDDETDISSYATIAVSGTTLTVSFANLCETAALAGDSVVVTYEVNAYTDQSSGASGYVNTAWATYPTFDGTGKTIPDTTTVYSFGISVKKLNTSAGVLQGAVFALQDAEGQWLQEDGTWGEEETRATFTSGEDGLVSGIPALDRGEYVLVELSAPVGYQLPDDPCTNIVIEADVASTASTGIQLTVSASGAGVVDAVDATEGTFVVSVVNEPTTETGGGSPTGSSSSGGNSSTAYPQTGQTLAAAGLVVLGLCLIVAAIVVQRRRNAAAQEG